MVTSNAGIDLIKRFEGFRAVCYKDTSGLPTIGYGTLIDTDEEKYLLTTTISEKEATRLLQDHLSTKVEPVLNRVIKSRLNQCQFDALVSFAYNLGTGALRGSTLLKIVNLDPNNPVIRHEFMRWVYDNGKLLNGLVRRRQAEADLYFAAKDMT